MAETVIFKTGQWKDSYVLIISIFSFSLSDSFPAFSLFSCLFLFPSNLLLFLSSPFSLFSFTHVCTSVHFSTCCPVCLFLNRCYIYDQVRQKQYTIRWGQIYAFSVPCFELNCKTASFEILRRKKL